MKNPLALAALALAVAVACAPAKLTAQTPDEATELFELRQGLIDRFDRAYLDGDMKLFGDVTPITAAGAPSDEICVPPFDPALSEIYVWMGNRLRELGAEGLLLIKQSLDAAERSTEPVPHEVTAFSSGFDQCRADFERDADRCTDKFRKCRKSRSRAVCRDKYNDCMSRARRYYRICKNGEG